MNLSAFKFCLSVKKSVRDQIISISSLGTVSKDLFRSWSGTTQVVSMPWPVPLTVFKQFLNHSYVAIQVAVRGYRI